MEKVSAKKRCYEKKQLLMELPYPVLFAIKINNYSYFHTAFSVLNQIPVELFFPSIKTKN